MRFYNTIKFYFGKSAYSHKAPECICMIPLKFKEMFYIDCSLAYAIIKQYGLTGKDKAKIEKVNMDPGVRKAIYEILKIA